MNGNDPYLAKTMGDYDHTVKTMGGASIPAPPIGIP